MCDIVGSKQGLAFVREGFIFLEIGRERFQKTNKKVQKIGWSALHHFVLVIHCDSTVNL